MTTAEFKKMAQCVSQKFSISEEDAERVCLALELEHEGAPDAMGAIDTGDSNMFAGRNGWWAAWRMSGGTVFTLNGGQMFADVDDADFRELIGVDADTDLFHKYCI